MPFQEGDKVVFVGHNHICQGLGCDGTRDISSLTGMRGAIFCSHGTNPVVFLRKRDGSEIPVCRYHLAREAEYDGVLA